MTLADYIEQAKQFAADHAAGDSSGLELLAKIAFEAEEAKQALRRSGFGYTGVSLKETVSEVLDSIGKERA